MAEMIRFNHFRPCRHRSFVADRKAAIWSNESKPVPLSAPADSGGNSCSAAGSNGIAEEMYHPTKVLVRNVKNLSKQEIHRFFTKFGCVTSVEKWPKSNTALVRFDRALDASAVLQTPLHYLLYGGRQLVVEKRLLMKSVVLPKSPSQVDYSTDVPGTSIHCLPDEVLEYIFAYLTPKQRLRTEQVCKYWRSLGKDVPWRSPAKLTLDSDHNPDYDPLTDKIIESLLSRCGLAVKQLMLNRRRSIELFTLGKAVENVCRFCPNLVELKLSSIPVNNRDLELLGAKCNRLKSLTLHHTDFAEENFSKFLKQCESLECLELGDNYNVSGPCFVSLGKDFKILCLNDCVMLDNALGKSLTASCYHLQELKLPHCNRLEADMVVQIAHKYKKTLKVLHMDGYIRDIDWCTCLEVLHNLEDLSLDECSKVDDKLLSVLAKSCTKLRALNVGATNITDEGLFHLAAAPCLKLLDISYTDQILGEGVEALAAQGKLEEVFIRSNLEVSDDMCHSFAAFCSNLRLLDLSDAPEISNMLVNSFCASIERGVLKGPVKLVVGGTSVTEDAPTCEKLELVFENTSRRDLCSDIDDYTDDDSDFDYYSYNSGYDSYDYDSDNPFDEPFLFFW